MTDKFAEFRARFRAARAETERRKAQEHLVKFRLTTAERELARVMRLRRTSIPLSTLTGEIERDEAALALLRHDALWTSVAVVIVGQYQHCRCCGHRASATTGFFIREQHKTIPSAKRLRSVDYLPDHLPVEKSLDGVLLERCVECVGDTIVDDVLAQICARETPPGLSNQLRLNFN